MESQSFTNQSSITPQMTSITSIITQLETQWPLWILKIWIRMYWELRHFYTLSLIYKTLWDQWITISLERKIKIQCWGKFNNDVEFYIFFGKYIKRSKYVQLYFLYWTINWSNMVGPCVLLWILSNKGIQLRRLFHKGLSIRWMSYLTQVPKLTLGRLNKNRNLPRSL